jgi:hypothetical protein
MIGKLIKINRCKLFIQIVELGFPTHVTNCIGDCSRVDLRGYHEIIFPVGFDLMNDAGSEFLVFVERSLGGFLEKYSPVDEIELVFVVLDDFVEVLRSCGFFDDHGESDF